MDCLFGARYSTTFVTDPQFMRPNIFPEISYLYFDNHEPYYWECAEGVVVRRNNRVIVCQEKSFEDYLVADENGERFVFKEELPSNYRVYESDARKYNGFEIRVFDLRTHKVETFIATKRKTEEMKTYEIEKLCEKNKDGE